MEGKGESQFKPPEEVPVKLKKKSSKRSAQTTKQSNQKTSDSRTISLVSDLDNTCDFSSGCTPYKIVAKNVAGKQKLRNLSRRHLERSQGKLKEEFESDEGSEHSHVVMEDPDVTMKFCNACESKVLLTAYDIHIKDCLKKKFQRSGTRNMPDSNHATTSRSEEIICQICREDLGSLTEDERQQHSNACIDGNLPAEPVNATECQICGQNLSHLNSNRQTQHINRCIDKSEQEKVAAAEALEKARNKVLDCPLCGQAVKTNNSRKVHMKKCAKQCGVSAAVLRQRIQEQEDAHKLQIEAGVLPLQNPQPRRRCNNVPAQNVASGVTTSATFTDKLRFDEPSSKLDEDTQLALALSESKQEDRFRKSRASGEGFTHGSIPMESVTVTESAKPGKDAFSILMTPKQSLKNQKKKGRKKIEPEKRYELVTLTQEHRMRCLQEKVAKVMSSQGNDEVCSTPDFPGSRVCNEISCADEPVMYNLWTTDHSSNETDRQMYYVKQLHPHVVPSAVEAGSKLKNMSKIPGWKPLHPLDVTLVQGNSSETQTSTPDSTISNQTLLASTQTAVLLAELACNSTTLDTTSLHNTPSSTHSNTQKSNNQFKPNKTVQFSVPDDDIAEPQGFCSPAQSKKQQESANEKLISDLETLLSTCTDGDIIICTRDGVKRHAHSLLIQLRCPALLHRGGQKEIDLTEYSPQCVDALLRYIYSAHLTVPAAVAIELCHLAQSMELHELISACVESAQQKQSTDRQDPDVEMSHPSHQLIDQTLQNLLHDAWGTDSDGSDEDNVETAKEGQNSGMSPKEDDDDELELDEIYRLVASQKVMKNRDSDGEKDEQMKESDSDRAIETANDTALPVTMSFALMQKLEESFMVNSPQNGMKITQLKKLNKIMEEDSDQDADEEEISDVVEKPAKDRPPNLAVNDDDDVIHLDESSNDSEFCMDHNSETLKYKDYPVSSEEKELLSNSVSFGRKRENIQNSWTPVQKVSKSSWIQDETTPDLFGGNSSSDGSVEQENDIDEDFKNSAKYNRQTYITSPGDDLFDSDDPAENNIQVPMDATPGRESPVIISENVSEDEANLVSDGRKSEDNSESHNVPDFSEANPSPVSTMQNSSRSPSDSNKVKRLGASQDITKQLDNRGKIMTSCEKRKRADISSSSSNDESEMISIRKRQKRSLQDESKVGNSFERKVHDISNTSDLECSPVFTGNNATKQICHSNASSPEPVIDLTLEEMDVDIGNISGLSHSPVIGLVSLTALDSPMDESIVNGANNFDSTSPCHMQEKKKDNAMTLHSTSDISENVDKKFDSDVPTNHEQSGYSVVEEWGDFINDDGYDFGIPATQGPSLLEDSTTTTTYQNNDEDFNKKDFENDPVLNPELDSEPDVANLETTEYSSEPVAYDSFVTEISPEKEDTSPQVSSQAKIIQSPHPTSSHLKDKINNTPFKTPTQLPLSVRRRPIHTPEYDPPTDMDTDVSMVMDEVSNSSLWEDHNAPQTDTSPPRPAVKKTRKVRSSKAWAPPSPFTPMADYSTMETPELKKRCQKVGVRPLPKKKMIVVLKDIYGKTHSYETDSDYDGTPAKKPMEQATQEAIHPEPATKKHEPKPKPSTAGPPKVKTSKSKAKISKSNASTDKKIDQMSSKRTQLKPTLQDEEDSLNSSQELNSSSCSQDSEGVMSDLPEESILITDDVEQEAKLSKKDLAYKRQCIWDLILSDEQLHLKILHYEPLDFMRFHEQLKSSGLNVGVKVVSDFLDDQNVLFTMKNKTESRWKKKSRRGASQSQRSTQK